MSCLDKHHILEIEDLWVSFTQYEKGLRQIELPVISKLHVSVHSGGDCGSRRLQRFWEKLTGSCGIGAFA